MNKLFNFQIMQQNNSRQKDVVHIKYEFAKFYFDLSATFRAKTVKTL